LIGKPEVKRLLERPRYGWEDNIRMDLWGIGWEGVHRIRLRTGTSGGLLWTRGFSWLSNC